MTKTRTYGPDPLPPDQLRSKRLSVYVTDAELAELQHRAALVHMRTPAYLRECALNKLPPVVPEINKEAWLTLSKAAANLNQLSKKMNVVGMVESSLIMRELSDFRQTLLKAAKNEG